MLMGTKTLVAFWFWILENYDVMFSINKVNFKNLHNYNCFFLQLREM